MMLRNLLDEVIRRRLWPIPLVAVLVAVAAPLLFLKSAPPDAPPVSLAAPAAAPAGDLPARAQRLLTGSGGEAAASRRTRSRKSDPFQAPSSHAGSSSASQSGSPAGDTAASEPTSGAASSADAGAGVPAPTTPASPRQPADSEGPDTSPSPGARWVDVRFGTRVPAELHRNIPRLQTFSADGRIVAIFVKYSPNRDKAVFAIAPGTRIVEGDVKCRRKAGLCRYIDIPAGKGVRLRTRASDGARVIRRLDVERTARPSGADVAARASGETTEGRCLLGKMLALGASDMPLAGDACNG
jgi:hypothetical protein